MGFRIGIDVGGTFTDLFLWSSDGRVETYKTLSTPDDPSVGVLSGLRLIADAQGLGMEQLTAQTTTIVHGTTVTTNATLTRGGAKTGLLTTAGVRDALEMRRGIREEQYDNRYPNVVPLVPRALRRPVRGRLDYAGREIEPLSLEDLREATQRFAREGVEAVAICFMNAFASPAHERAAEEVVRSALPGVRLSVSSEVLPLVRFYNRISTTVVNAYVGPILHAYLQSLTTKLADAGFSGTLLIMQSNGGVALPEAILQRPASTLLSGPAAGPCAAAVYAGSHERDAGDAILVDMGGTSFDASMVQAAAGAAAMKTEGEIDRLRIALPMLDIVTIGAGGGSIGWLDEGGLLRMGPQSAGAVPGPACYGRGGNVPTCTDANLVLGYLDPLTFAGGKLPLDADRACEAVRTRIAEPLGLSTEQGAAGMYRVINNNMAHGVREITVKRGVDPRQLPLVVAGGAGALHACAIALELDISKVLVPATASVLCAHGMLLSDLRHDFARSCVSRFGEVDLSVLREHVAAMSAEGEEQLRREGVAAEQVTRQVLLDLRYVKQYHEVTVPVPDQALQRGELDAIAERFHAEHDRLYGYELSAEGTDIELINVRVCAVGKTDKPPSPRLPLGGPDPSAAHRGKRRAYVPERNAFEEVPVLDGHALSAGNVITGPALVERVDTTVLVSGSFVATVDGQGSFVLTRRED